MSSGHSAGSINGGDVIFIAGVSGSGKTTVGAGLAHRLGVAYLEADEFHPPANVEKMSSGEALTDDDRWPWLESLARTSAQTARDHGGVVTSCSALKQSYRRYLTEIVANTNRTTSRFILLHGDRETIRARMVNREDHFMPEALLDSQLATLELPIESEPDIAVVDIGESVEDIVDSIINMISQHHVR